MAASEISIVNLALGHIGTRSTIASLSEASTEARVARLYYEPTRDEVLSMAFWNFSKKTATLALLKSAPGTPSNPTGATEWSDAYPAPPWLYEYAYPADCIQMRSLVPQVQTGVIGVPLFSSSIGMYPYVQGPAARFEAATDTDDTGAQINVILTNMYQAIGQYTMQVTNPTLFSSQFVMALSFALAAKMCNQLTGNKGLAQALYGQANQQILQARASDGNEGLTVQEIVPDWIKIRDTDGVAGYGYYVAPYNSLYVIA